MRGILLVSLARALTHTPEELGERNFLIYFPSVIINIFAKRRRTEWASRGGIKLATFRKKSFRSRHLAVRSELLGEGKKSENIFIVSIAVRGCDI
jgi:NOL1/NOP2/fmu family ribosome biogenesis protein